MVAWVRRRDKLNKLELLPYQEAPSPPMTPQMVEACHRAIHVITPEGEVLRAGRAALFILKETGSPLLARVGNWIPFIWFVEIGYWLLARYRGKLYKWIFRHFDPQRGQPMKH